MISLIFLLFPKGGSGIEFWGPHPYLPGIEYGVPRIKHNLVSGYDSSRNGLTTAFVLAFCIAILAVYRTVFSRFERDFTLFLTI
jgi:hypothetical protein